MDASVITSGKLKLGASGAAVTELRNVLHSKGYVENYSVANPALFDAWMNAAVRDFQTKNNLTVDGIVGPKTWAALTGQVVQPATNVPIAADTGLPEEGMSLPMMIGALGLLGLGAYYLYSRKGAMSGFGADDPVEDEIEKRISLLRMKQADGEIDEQEFRLRSAEIRRTFSRGGRGPAKALPTYAPAKLVGGQRFIPGSVRKPGRRTVATTETISRELKRMSQRAPESGRIERRWTHDEEQLWSKRDQEDAKRTGRGGAQGSTYRMPVAGKLYRADEAYRDRVQDAAREKAEKEMRRVTIVDDNGRVLFDYLPPVKRYSGFKAKGKRKLGDMSDAVSEGLIAKVETEARERNCKKAVRDLFRARGLVTNANEARVYDRAERAVNYNCPGEVKAELKDRSEIRRSLPGTVIPLTPAKLMSVARAKRKQKLRDAKKAERERAKQGMRPDTRPDAPELPVRGGRLVDPETLFEVPAKWPKGAGRVKVKADPRPIRLRPGKKGHRAATMFPTKRGYRVVRDRD